MLPQSDFLNRYRRFLRQTHSKTPEVFIRFGRFFIVISVRSDIFRAERHSGF